MLNRNNINSQAMFQLFQGLFWGVTYEPID